MNAQDQKNIREQGKTAFRNGTSSNPYKEGTHSFDLFLDGWLEESHDHYYKNKPATFK